MAMGVAVTHRGFFRVNRPKIPGLHVALPGTSHISLIFLVIPAEAGIQAGGASGDALDPRSSRG